MASPLFYLNALNASSNRGSADAAIIAALLVVVTYVAFYIYYALVDAGVIKAWAKSIEKHQHQEPKELKGSNLIYFNKKFFDYNVKSNFTITEVIIISAIFLISAFSFLYFLSIK